ncbi:MAG: GspE/PulE family protein [Patescibacteria group bacterium]
MNDDITSQNEKSIDDLIGAVRANQSGKIRVSTDEVEEKLKSKIREIATRKKEADTRERASSSGAGYIFLKGFPVSSDALSLLPEEEARRLKAVCFFKTDTEIRIGAIAPEDPEVLALVERLSSESRARGGIYQISRESFDAVMKLYETLPRPRKFVAGIELKAEDLEKFSGQLKSFRDLAEKIQHVSITDVFTIIMAGGIQARASDVHIEAQQEDIKIRYRIDGALYDVAALPKKMWPQVINRAKLIAKLKINVVDEPQDGRFTIYLGKDFIDVRVSTVPSAFGESIVMRLLMSSATSLTLDDLGLVGVAYDIMKKEIDRPNGMILTTGPTGSGKTTTLYAILKKLNTSESKIITLENPIEYRIKGITQSQVQSSEQSEGDQKTGSVKKHYTYASGLRAVLRQDPDIVMVGEIRDHETAEIAIQAALTGHLMLSTLHTNSAAGAVPRLMSMEVKPFLLAPSLNVLIGQRLTRKVCPDCKEEYTPDAETLAHVQEVLKSVPDDKKQNVDINDLHFYHGKGCEKCSDIGFKGRIGIFEIVTMNQDIEKLILTGQVSEYQIKDIAKKHGMLTMVQDGILKSLTGITTPEEVFKVTE